MLSLTQRLIALAVILAALAGGILYVRHLSIQNRAQKAEIAALKESAKITHKQQEVSDRVQIELDDLREKNRKLAAGLNRDLAGWLRNKSGMCATPGPAPSAPASSAESKPGATDSVDDFAAICTASAVESDDRAEVIAAWQRWYSEIRALRQ